MVVLLRLQVRDCRPKDAWPEPEPTWRPSFVDSATIAGLPFAIAARPGRCFAEVRGAAGETMETEIIRMGGLELRFLQTRETTGGGIDMFEMTVQPNARMPVAHYQESWDEAVYGLSGTLAFRVDGQDHAVGPGQSLFIGRGVVHGFSNDTQAPATCLCVLTPGVLGPGYFREIAGVLAAGAPDPARMKEIMLRHGLVPAPAG
jgi:quercetin dioxygenase-like cupin family protein